MSRSFLIRVFGWRAILVQADVLFVERVSWLKKRLRTGPIRTLDAGCGVGGLSMLAGRAGNNVLGLTFSAEDAAVASTRATLIGAQSVAFEVLDLRRLGSELTRLGQFDQIIACEVIEHLKDDAGLIANLATLLKPGGQLLLTTPSTNHYPVYRELQHVSGVEDGRHVRFGYTHAELEKMFIAAGVTVAEKGYLNGFFSQKVFSLYLLLGRIHPKVGWLLTLPFRPLRFLDPVVRSLTKYPDMSVTLVGVKNA
jgi:SAM-dependent methyltransferase